MWAPRHDTPTLLQRPPGLPLFSTRPLGTVVLKHSGTCTQAADWLAVRAHTRVLQGHLTPLESSRKEQCGLAQKGRPLGSRMRRGPWVPQTQPPRPLSSAGPCASLPPQTIGPAGLRKLGSPSRCSAHPTPRHPTATLRPHQPGANLSLPRSQGLLTAPCAYFALLASTRHTHPPHTPPPTPC